MKSKLKYISHVPDWGFVSSPVSVNLLVQTLVWTCELWSLTDFTTSIHTHTHHFTKVSDQTFVIGRRRISRIHFEKLFFFFFPRKELNVIQQLKDDKFTDWILKIRKRILHAASLCTHRNITKSEANIENS